MVCCRQRRVTLASPARQCKRAVPVDHQAPFSTIVSRLRTGEQHLSSTPQAIDGTGTPEGEGLWSKSTLKGLSCGTAGRGLRNELVEPGHGMSENLLLRLREPRTGACDSTCRQSRCQTDISGSQARSHILLSFCLAVQCSW